MNETTRAAAPLGPWRRTGLALAALCLAAVAAVLAPHAARAETLTVAVSGLRNAVGLVEVAVCGDETCYDHQRGFAAVGREPAALPTVLFTFAGLQPGRYALMMFHDENGNGRYDRDFLGLPREGYGFSNDAKPVFGKPSWRKVAFEVPEGGAGIAVTMQYFNGE